MAYMPLDKSKFYLDDSKMVKVYDLSQPWGMDTPCGPSPVPVPTCNSPVASTWAASISAP